MIRSALASLLALAALSLAQPCEAAIGTPTAILAFETPTAGPPTTSTGTTVDAPAGSLIVIYAAAFNIGDTTMGSTCTLSDGDTAVRAISNTPTVGAYTSTLYYVSNSAHDLPVGGTITCNSGTNQTGLAAWVITGASGGLDKTNSTQASGGVTSISLASGTLSTSSEILFGSINIGSTQTLTEAPGFTTLVAYASGTTNADISYKIVSANSSVTYNPTFSGGGNSGLLATFEATGSANNSHLFLLLGVGF
jgi:hypothetical protein